MPNRHNENTLSAGALCVSESSLIATAAGLCPCMSRQCSFVHPSILQLNEVSFQRQSNVENFQAAGGLRMRCSWKEGAYDERFLQLLQRVVH